MKTKTKMWIHYAMAILFAAGIMYAGEYMAFAMMAFMIYCAIRGERYWDKTQPEYIRKERAKAKVQEMLEQDVGKNWEGKKKTGMYKWYVVCAANRHKPSGLVVCGHRHFDKIMRGVIATI